MPTLSDTLARLKAARLMPAGSSVRSDRLRPLPGWSGSAGLRAHIFVPDDLPAGAPLVVVLHGCKQDAAGYDAGAGWSTLAERHGFALLFPEQQPANNPNGCFNWFDPAQTARGRGEAAAIAEMVGTMVAAHRLDSARVFIGGLSAGGAMTAVMLATYPELFAGGAIIAGLPFGTARTVPQAFERMRGQGGPRGDALATLVRDASGHRGPWPTLSIWHGNADATVSDANVDILLDQWRPLHGARPAPDHVDAIDGHRRRVWRDAAGRDAIEVIDIAGLGHGTPLGTGGDDGLGNAGPFMLEAGISSTRHIARFWGLVDAAEMPIARPQAPSSPPPRPAPVAAPAQDAIGRIIDDAFRSAGLLR